MDKYFESSSKIFGVFGNRFVRIWIKLRLYILFGGVLFKRLGLEKGGFMCVLENIYKLGFEDGMKFN